MFLDCPLTPLQFAVICQLVNQMELHGMTYQVTGGLAGNIHGSHWPLHDIDLAVATTNMAQLAALFAPMVTFPLGRYRDHEFDLQLLRLNISGVNVDVSQAEGGYAVTAQGRQPLRTALERRTKANFWGLELYVQSLEDLIADKTTLGRTADLEDLKALAWEQAIDLPARALA
jgi:hypothetical protein